MNNISFNGKQLLKFHFIRYPIVSLIVLVIILSSHLSLIGAVEQSTEK